MTTRRVLREGESVAKRLRHQALQTVLSAETRLNTAAELIVLVDPQSSTIALYEITQPVFMAAESTATVFGIHHLFLLAAPLAETQLARTVAEFTYIRVAKHHL